MATATPHRALVTGASGLLGRAVMAAFNAAPGWSALGTAMSRAGEGLLRLDVRDAAAVAALLAEVRPSIVVHCAAERRPDACEKEPAAAELLNIDAVWHVGRAAAKLGGCGFVHVSTDYLFDGTAAPYTPDSPLSPLNAYGRQKARAEHAALAAHEAAIVLRVPVLYGPTSDLNESAVTTFAEAVKNAGKAQCIDDWQIRVPTFTPDIAATLVRMADALAAGTLAAGVYQYSSKDRTTRWQLCQTFGRLLGLPTAHITRLDGMPPGAPRPYDCQLDTGKLEAAGCAAPCTPLEAGLRIVLGLPPA